MKLYFIKEGNHYSEPRRLGIYWGQKKVSFQVNFDSSCFFSIDKNAEYLDINKLFGYSFLYHMKNSIRVGWRPSDKLLNQIDLFFFFHQNGKFSFEYFSTVKCEQVYQVDMENDFKNNTVLFTLKGGDGFVIIKAAQHYKYPKIRFGYYLSYFFGGTLPAPQDMWVEMGRV